MFHVYIKSILECLQRYPDVCAEDITVACFGGALQQHLPHCVALLGPQLRWELWRDACNSDHGQEQHCRRRHVR